MAILKRLSAVLAAVCLLASGAAAADSIWNAGTGNWTPNPPGWTPWLNQEPTLAYDAVIDNGGTAQIFAGNSEYADDLFLGNTAGHSGYVVMYGGLLGVKHHQYIGYDGTGGFTQYDGANYCSYGVSGYDLRIGYNTGSTGTYTMSGGTCQAADNYAGNDGTGAFIQTGGTNNVGWSDALHHLYIASEGTGTGTYRLGGTTSQLNLQHRNGNIYVGGSGAGRFEWFRTGGGGIYIGHSGGTGKMIFASYLLGTLAMGYDFNVGTLMADGYGVVTENLTYATLEITNGATGTLNTAVNPWIGDLRVGTMTGAGYGVQSHASSSLVVRQDEWIGRGGTGTYTQSAGGHSIAWHLYVGNDVGASAGNGAFYLQGGTLSCDVLAIGTNLVDDGGVGLLQQTNGTMTVSGTGNVFLGRTGSGHSGTYKISGGAWNVSGFVSGTDNGHIIVDGGTVSIAGSINVRTFTVGESGTGSFTLGSGKSLTAYAQYVGKGSTGTFYLNGGTNTVTTDLSIAAVAGTGTYDLSSGTLSVSGAVVGGAGGTLIKDGGTLTVTGNITVGTFILGDTGGSTGSYALSGSKQLSAGAEYVGKGGTGQLTQGGGTHSVSGHLYVGYSGGSSGSVSHTSGNATVGGNVYLGYAGGSVGSYDAGGGTLSAGGTIYLGYGSTASTLALSQNAVVVADLLQKYATATFTDTAGPSNTSVLRVNQLSGMSGATVGGYLQIGHSGGSGSGSHSVAGGESLSVGRDLTVGYNAAGTFIQTGGTVTVGGSLALAAQGAASGSYTLGGGALSLAAIQKGTGSGGSTFIYDGGTLAFAAGKAIDVGSLRVGHAMGAVAALDLAAGDSVSSSDLLVGDKGQGAVTQTGGTVSGQLTVGGTSGVGLYTFTGGSLGGGPLSVRAGQSAMGQFTGRGVVAMTGLLQNSGRVTADGDYAAAALNLASLSSVANAWENAYTGGTNGWFAINTGKLLLPSVRIGLPMGDTYNWGESPFGGGPGQDAEIDLVNSVQVHFDGLEMDDKGGGGGGIVLGLMSIDLLAIDRSDLPAPPQGVTFIGAWDVHSPGGVTFETADLMFRYDDALAARLGIEESDLRVYHWDGSQWQDVWTGADTDKNLIWADDLATLSPFAVGNVPEPATVALVAGGAAVMFLAGRRCRPAAR